MKHLSPLIPLLLAFGLFAGCDTATTPYSTHDDAALKASAPLVAVPFEPGENLAVASKGANGVHSDCTFTEDVANMVMYLDADCTTDGTLFVPDGWTLNGNKHKIAAIDPVAGHFVGAVIQNAGATAHVTQLTVTADNLANICDEGASRLRGIMFEDATGGSITQTIVTGINQGPSGCQEGNSIEVRAAPFDGSGPYPSDEIVIAQNVIEDFQKTGIVANGNVVVQIVQNSIGVSATEENLAANSVQIGFGAKGKVFQNQIAGNRWLGLSDYAATAVLVFLSGDDLRVYNNEIIGNADIGLYIYGDDGRYYANSILDDEGDGPQPYDIGVGDWGLNNRIDRNEVCGFDTPFDPAEPNGKRNTVCGVAI